MEYGMGNTLILFQIADTSWPTGSFAFSNGLEALAKSGHIQDMRSFSSYLHSYLIQLSEADLAFMNSIFEVDEGEFETRLYPILTNWHAFIQVETMRRANILLGENWLNLIASVYSPDGMERLRSFFDTEHRPAYFTIVFPLLLKMIGCDLMTIHTLFYHMAVREQVNAAVRLGLFGPEMAQKTHFVFIELCENLREQYRARRYDEACRSQPVLELAQGSHQYLYSRLFQN